MSPRVMWTDAKSIEINWNSFFSIDFRTLSKENQLKVNLNQLKVNWTQLKSLEILNLRSWSKTIPDRIPQNHSFWRVFQMFGGDPPPRTNQDLTDSAMGTLPSGHPSQLRLFWKGTNTQQSLFHEWYLYFTNIYT